MRVDINGFRVLIWGGGGGSGGERHLRCDRDLAMLGRHLYFTVREAWPIGYTSLSIPYHDEPLRRWKHVGISRLAGMQGF